MNISNYRLTMAQLNPLVGDIKGNQYMIEQAIKQARDEEHAQCIVFPELVLTGYPPEDLLLKPSFITDCAHAIDELAKQCGNIIVVIGAPYRDSGNLYNAAYVLEDHKIATIALKQGLPNYSVFDEDRYFEAGNRPCVIELGNGLRAGITICEDIWLPGPARALADNGADLIINLNASPYHLGKKEQRLKSLRSRIEETGLPIIYVNQTGGQDELVFDGSSKVLNSHGEIQVRAPDFEQGLYCVDINAEDSRNISFTGEMNRVEDEEAQLYQALVIGVRDYVNKNGFTGAILGLSGGIDSALTLSVAVDALGPDQVSAVMMPSRYTSDISLHDAEEEAHIFGIEYHVIPIEPAFEAFKHMLSGVFKGSSPDVTEENLQARSRGVTLMAISNKQGRIVLTTGNKSEMAVGYATLYGDMAGGFAPLKDVYKTMVYRLARYRNSLGRVIPERVIKRAPSAELAPNQTDQDTLPDYEVLDNILMRYVELDQSAEEIISSGYESDVVYDVIKRVDRNEYKRRQAPPGIKVTERAFGKDRRYPITSGYVER